MAVTGLFAPGYYGEFECIKGECRHSCCIGWEIDIDERTLEKYSSLSGELGKEIGESISVGDEPHFVLSVGGRCPHLDECGLCRIITELGDGYLSDICRLHPRFFNDTAHGREVGLGMSCEEACRIILSSDAYRDSVKIGEARCEVHEFDAVAHRSELYAALSDREVPYRERLAEIYNRFSVSPTLLSDGEWRGVLSSLEYLSPDSAQRFSQYSSEVFNCEWDIMLERALAYFVYRHCSGAKSIFEFRTGLGFALFCERLLASVAKYENIGTKGEFLELARLVSEEIEYSSDNTDVLRAEIEFAL